MIRRSTSILLAACLLLFGAFSAAADVLVLKDGRRIEGTIISESSSSVRIKTRLGELEFARSKVDSIERGKSKRQEYDERWKAAKTADDFHELGLWAEKQEMRTQTRKCMRKAVKLDAHHAAAHTWLGHVEYKGDWMPPEERDVRRKEDHEAEMKARGLVPFEGKWVKPSEKKKLERGLVLQDGRWMDPDDAQRAKGLEKFEERWLPRAEALARIDAAEAAERAQESFATVLNEQALFAGPVPLAELQKSADGILIGREWFDRLYRTEPGLALLGDRLAEFYLFGSDPAPFENTTSLFASWTQTVPDGWADAVKRVHGFLWWDPFPLSSARRWHRDDYDLTGHCYHHWGHLLLNRLGYDGRLLPPWYDESFGALMEVTVHGRNAVFCRARAEPGQGTAAKTVKYSFDPKLLREGKWRQVVKGALEAKRVRSIDKLAQLEFSELELLDIAAGMAILDWMHKLPDPEEGVSAIAAFHGVLREVAPDVPLRVIVQTRERQDAYDAAFQAAAGMGWRQADAAWRSWFLAQ